MSWPWWVRLPSTPVESPKLVFDKPLPLAKLFVPAMKEPSIQTPFDPSKLIVHVRALSDDIGPRGTGTAEEAQAAAYVHSHLQALGISELERQHFRAVTSQNYFPLTVGALSLLALLIYPLIPPLSRWVAAVMAGLAAPLLSQTIRTADSPFRALMPQRRSQNVIARLPPTQDARRRAVLLAHLDTNRVAWLGKREGYPWPSRWYSLRWVSMALMARFISSALWVGHQSCILSLSFLLPTSSPRS